MTMPRLWVALRLLAVGISFSFVGQCFAVPSTDASNNAGPNSSALTLAPSNFRAQSFTVTNEGLISQVDVQIGKFAGAATDVRFELRPLVSGAPTRDDRGMLYMTMININDIPVINSLADPPPYVSVDVSSAGIRVKPGEQYAISLRRSGSSPNAAWRAKPNTYAGGNGFFRSLLTSPWSATTDDYGFQTWVDPTPTAPYKLRIDPTFDVDYRPGTGTVSSLVEGETATYIGGIPGSTTLPEKRPIMEFPLAGLPAGAVIQGAQLELDFYVSSGAPRIEITGYAGDGLASFSDATVTGTVLATTPPTTASSSGILPLDASFIASLVGNASHVGLRLRGLDGSEYVGFNTTEETFSTIIPPRLVISYTLPLSVPGDFNSDGMVNSADYVSWRNNDDTAQGYTTWRANFGTGGGSGAGEIADGANVPEPVSIAIILAATAILPAKRATRIGR